MTDEQLKVLNDAFVRCTFPEGREAYMREFEAKFETSVNNMKIAGGINRAPNPYWKNSCA